MMSIKGRFLKRFRTIPSSIYTSKQQHVALPTCCDQSLCRLSSCSNMQNPPNYDYIQQEHRTNTSFDPTVQHSSCTESMSYLGQKNGHIMSCDLEPTKEIDVFEECESEFDDTLPDMVHSTSSSSCTSPINIERKSSSGEVEHVSFDTTNLLDFEEKCPPGGADKVILYTTSLRGIRKTYEDCTAIKFLLESLRVVYFERDVSMHLEFRDELWEILGGRSIPPRLFIKGRHIGGAVEVVALHEIGTLKKLMEGIPVLGLGSHLKCSECGGVRFLLCSYCCGSCKVYKGDQQGNLKDNLFGRCLKCNENGLIKCPTCS